MSMILLIIRMKVLSEKRMELSQAIVSLIGSIRTEKGCKRCDFCQGMEDGNRLFLLEEWDTEENLMSYLKSGRFRVLRGAMNLLKEPHEMIFHTVFDPAGNGVDLMDKLISRAYDKSYGSHERPREIRRIR
jgi:quinol monooxygenase YgiN